MKPYKGTKSVRGFRISDRANLMKTFPTGNYDKKSCSNCSPFYRRMLILETFVFTIIEGAAYSPESAQDDEACAHWASPEKCVEVSVLCDFVARPKTAGTRGTNAVLRPV